MEILSMGEKIRRRRKSLRLTLKDVAGNSVTPAQLSYVESDKCKPSRSLLSYICKKIDLDMDYVLETESQQAEKYCDYFLKDYEFYIRRGELKEAWGKLDKAEELACEYGLLKQLGKIKLERGRKSLEEGNIERGEIFLLSALQIFMKLDYRGYAVDCYYCLGIIALKRNYLEDALRLLKTSSYLADNEASPYKVSYSKVLFSMAKVYYKMGKNHECRQNVFKAIEKAEKEGDDFNRAELLIKCTDMLEGKEMLFKCDSYLDEAIRIYKNGDCLDQKIMYIKVIKALVHIKSGDEDSALNYCKEVLQNSGENLDLKAICCLLKLCYYLLLRGYKKNVLTILDTIDKNNLNDEIFLTYHYLRYLSSKDEDDDIGKEHLIKCMKYLKESNPTDISIKISLTLGELYREDQDYCHALEYLIKGVKLISTKLASN